MTSKPTISSTGKVRGFSLIELMIVVVLMGIIMSIAVPAGRDFIIQSRLTTQANLLVSDLLIARNEAANRGVTVALCPRGSGNTCSATGTDWMAGRLIYSDLNGNAAHDAGEPFIKVGQALPQNMALTVVGFNNLTQIRFNSSGGSVPLGSSGTFKLCVTDFPSGRQITVAVNGRPLSSRVNCP